MDSISQFLTVFGGLAVFVVVLADQAGLPIPAPPWLLAAGALVAGGKLDPVLAVGMTTLGALLADLLWFFLGRQGGGWVRQLISRWTHGHNPSSAEARTACARHGMWVLVVAKFLPGTVAPSLAGALGMSTQRFLICDGLAALFYGACYITTGCVFHNQIQAGMVGLDRLGHGLIGVTVVLVMGYLACKYAARRRSRAGNRQRSNLSDNQTGVVAVITVTAHPDPANLAQAKPAK